MSGRRARSYSDPFELTSSSTLTFSSVDMPSTSHCHPTPGWSATPCPFTLACRCLVVVVLLPCCGAINTDVHNYQQPLINVKRPMGRLDNTHADDTLCLGLQDIFVALFLILMILMTVLGNVLVVLSVFLYKRMRTFTNFLLTSLATADLLVGLLIMPLSLTDLLHNHNWPFGHFLCRIWATSDVLLCTASILNLVVISLDRYMAITSPLKYPRTRSKFMACILLCLVWGISMVVCSPPWFIPEWNLFYNNNEASRRESGFVCAYSPSVPYRIYSAMVSFYIPLMVMLFVYFKIFRVASEREKIIRQGLGTCRLSRRVEKTQRKGGFQTSLNNYHNRCASAPISRIREVQAHSLNNSNNSVSLCYKEHDANNCVNSYQTMQFHSSSHRHRSERPPLSRSETECSAEYESISNKDSFHSTDRGMVRGGMARESKSLINLVDSFKEKESLEPDRNTIVDKQQMENSINTHISSLIRSVHTANGEVTPNLNKQQVNNQINCYSKNRLQPVNLLAKAEKHYNMNGPGKAIRGSKEKIVYMRERKALKTIGIVVLGFIVCWMPFFVVYLLEVFLNDVSATYSFKLLNEFFLWLGYSNSVLNPIIYTMYNGDFRRCFQDLLGLGCVKQHRRTMSVKKLHQQNTLF